MRSPKSFLAFAAIVLLAAGISLYASLPRIQRVFICKRVAWDGGGHASFTVLGLMTDWPDGKPRVNVICHWDEPVAPWNRYQLAFPEGDVTYADGSHWSAGVSPISDGSFVIHYCLERAPHFLASVNIPIRCKDTAGNHDLGARVLSLRYWPDKRQSYAEFLPEAVMGGTGRSVVNCVGL